MTLLKLRKETFWYAAAAVGLITGVLIWRVDSQPAWANQFGSTGLASTGLVSHVVTIEGRGTRVVVIDPQLRAMGVYDLGQNGEINLRSIRRLSADLQMLEFNTGEPSPEDIQQRLEQ